MKKSKVLVGSILAVALIFTFGASQAMAADTIKVGIVLPLTGKLAKFGEIENKSFLMALKEINAAGGVNGKKIELIIEDTMGKPDVGRSAIEKLITQDKVVMLGGGYSSSVTWATIAVAQQNKIPFLVNTGSADKITEQGWEYIFRLNPPVSEYPGAFASFLETIATDVKTVAILHENSLFGQSGSKKFVKRCEALGLEVIMKEGYEAGAIDFKPLLLSGHLLCRIPALRPIMTSLSRYIMNQPNITVLRHILQCM
ncbi:MAG: ABC transporter substrate-binding protein [Desulfosarcina sp.]|nr:ABC transporter substrate-binding protein [Desulfosarcina sp.]MBC2766246.1 ABC transporter substrate-binding protein [Desulfosarcina sp.]